MAEKKIYLTFDDGPIPLVTPWVLNALKQYQAKATFFCVGENIEKHPEVYRQIKEEGHTIGNHTYNHLNGWRTRNTDYLENIEKCARAMGLPDEEKRPLFRPPYGKITQSQIAKILRPSAHQGVSSSPALAAAAPRIIMWDLLTYDYDPLVSPQQCLSYILRYARNGSIVVFHDSLKAKVNLEYALPKTLATLSAKGFTFESLTL